MRRILTVFAPFGHLDNVNMYSLRGAGHTAHLERLKKYLRFSFRFIFEMAARRINANSSACTNDLCMFIKLSR